MAPNESVSMKITDTELVNNMFRRLLYVTVWAVKTPHCKSNSFLILYSQHFRKSLQPSECLWELGWVTTINLIPCLIGIADSMQHCRSYSVIGYVLQQRHTQFVQPLIDNRNILSMILISGMMEIFLPSDCSQCCIWKMLFVIIFGVVRTSVCLSSCHGYVPPPLVHTTRPTSQNLE